MYCNYVTSDKNPNYNNQHVMSKCKVNYCDFHHITFITIISEFTEASSLKE